MLTKIFTITKIIGMLVFVIGLISMIIARIYWWKKNENRKGLSAIEYVLNADITDLTDEELQEINNEKDMMI